MHMPPRQKPKLVKDSEAGRPVAELLMLLCMPLLLLLSGTEELGAQILQPPHQPWRDSREADLSEGQHGQQL